MTLADMSPRNFEHEPDPLVAQHVLEMVPMIFPLIVIVNGLGGAPHEHDLYAVPPNHSALLRRDTVHIHPPGAPTMRS